VYGSVKHINALLHCSLVLLHKLKFLLYCLKYSSAHHAIAQKNYFQINKQKIRSNILLHLGQSCHQMFSAVLLSQSTVPLSFEPVHRAGQHCSFEQWRNWWGAGGQMPTWQFRCGLLFRNRSSLFGFLCFLNKFKNLKSLVYTNLFFAQQCLAKLCARALIFKWYRYMHCQDY